MTRSLPSAPAPTGARTGRLRAAPGAVRLRRAGGGEALALLLGFPPAAARAGSVARGPGRAPTTSTAGSGRRCLIAPLALELLLAPTLGLAKDVERVRLVVQQLMEAVGHGAAETLLHRSACGGGSHGTAQGALHAAAATAGPPRSPREQAPAQPAARTQPAAAAAPPPPTDPRPSQCPPPRRRTRPAQRPPAKQSARGHAPFSSRLSWKPNQRPAAVTSRDLYAPPPTQQGWAGSGAELMGGATNPVVPAAPLRGGSWMSFVFSLGLGLHSLLATIV